MDNNDNTLLTQYNEIRQSTDSKVNQTNWLNHKTFIVREHL